MTQVIGLLYGKKTFISCIADTMTTKHMHQRYGLSSPVSPLGELKQIQLDRSDDAIV